MATIKPEDCPSWEEGSTHTASPTNHTDYATACVKVEPRSDLDFPTSADTTAQIKAESLKCDHHSPYLTNHIKEESRDYKEGLLPPPGRGWISPDAPSPPSSAPFLCIKEEAESLEEGLDYTTVSIKEEPVSSDDGEFLPLDLSGGVHDEDEESDSDHAEVEYTTVHIKGEESSEEDYVENYATRDHTYMVTGSADRLKAPCNTRKLHKTLICAECGKVFFGKAAYRLHQKLHRGEAVYACATCGKKFSRKGSCEKHQEAAHKREKSFQCTNCDRYFSSKLGLTLHQRVHTREPAFSCKDCAKSFTSNSALLQHQRVHYTDRRLACAKCGASFDNKSDLINHEILHPVQQSYVCSECCERFPTKADLSAHWKVHTVIKAFSWRKIRFTHQETAKESGAAGEQPWQHHQ